MNGNDILTQIGDVLTIPRNQPGNRHIIQEISMQDGPISNNNPEMKLMSLYGYMNDREQPNLVLVNRNLNIDEVLANMQQN